MDKGFKQSGIIKIELGKFIQKFLILIALYLFTYAIGVSDAKFHLLMFYNLSILIGLFLLLLPFSSMFIFYLESNRQKESLNNSLRLLIIYIAFIFVFYQLINLIRHFEGNSIHSFSIFLMSCSMLFFIIFTIFNVLKYKDRVF